MDDGSLLLRLRLDDRDRLGVRRPERDGRHRKSPDPVEEAGVDAAQGVVAAPLTQLADVGAGREAATLTLLTLINALGVGPTMWLYAAFNVAAFLFVWRRMPELTGRSLEEIEGKLRDGKFKPADFAR